MHLWKEFQIHKLLLFVWKILFKHSPYLTRKHKITCLTDELCLTNKGEFMFSVCTCVCACVY